MQTKSRYAPLAGILFCLALSLLLYHSLAGGTLLSRNFYDSYSLQAENWLAGRNYIANGEDYTWLELAIYHGRYYQSFPPVPAVFMLPFVVLFGSAAAVPSNLIMLFVALLCAAGVYACCLNAKASPVTAAFLTLFISFGSNTFWLSTSGGVWFMAQMLGLCLAFWGLFFAQRGGRVLPSLLFALAVGCRPFYAVLLAVWFLWQLRADRSPRAVVSAAAPALVVAAAMMAYNYARFGSVTEFGHNYLPEHVNSVYGQFHPVYLLPNLLKLLRPITLDAALQLHFEIFNGFLFIAANPLFLLAFVRGIQLLRNAEPRRATPLPSNGYAVLLLCLLVTVLTAMHNTMGGWQFGTRYLIDLFPWVLTWFLARPGWKPGTAAWTLCGAAMLFNLYGAVYMLNT